MYFSQHNDSLCPEFASNIATKAPSALKSRPRFGVHVVAIAVLALTLVGGAMQDAAAKPAKQAASAATAVRFAQTTFETLARGNQKVASSIDWSNLKVFNTDAGASYRSMPNDHERSAFRSSFISSFAKSYKSTGAKPTSFKNWRVIRSSASASVIAADGGRGKMNFIITRSNGVFKLAGMQKG